MRTVCTGRRDYIQTDNRQVMRYVWQYGYHSRLTVWEDRPRWWQPTTLRVLTRLFSLIERQLMKLPRHRRSCIEAHKKKNYCRRTPHAFSDDEIKNATPDWCSPYWTGVFPITRFQIYTEIPKVWPLVWQLCGKVGTCVFFVIKQLFSPQRP